MFDKKYGHFTGTIPDECVNDCSHPGPCDADVAAWCAKLGFTAAIAEVHDLAVAYLKEFGAWDDLQTADDETLAQRILWSACCDIRESGEPWLGLVH